MKLNLKTAETVIRLLNGETIAYGKIKNRFIDEFIQENILSISGKHHKKVRITDPEQLTLYLFNRYSIKDIESYIRTLQQQNADRGDFVKLTGDSKLSKQRTFKGFLVNSYQPVQAVLNGSEMIINPPQGSFMFIYDFEHFRIPENITIVGMENSLNFRYIRKQAYLFADIEPLFVSRYPQSQNKDFIRWLRQIPNEYLHFGDFDYAGINIYVNEYKKHLAERARFFIPENIAEDIKQGSRERFNIQKLKFAKEKIEEEGLLELINIITQAQKGLDQEYYLHP